MIEWFQNLPAAAQVSIVSALVSAVIALLVAFANPFAARRLERLKAELAKEASLNDARTSYEFEARKRLYSEVEPLFFMLYEAAEGSYHRVASLVRTQDQGNLGQQDGSWLAQEGYYLRSTVYRLFLPLAIFRLIQRTATFVDIELDQKIRTRYFLLKLSYKAVTDDFDFAELEPKLSYGPNDPGWREKSVKEPATYRRQGLVIGILDRLVDAFIVKEDGTHRPMNYGEFEASYKNDKKFHAATLEAEGLFLGFSFPERPVLARMLVAHACIMRLLLLTYEKDMSQDDLAKALDDFSNSQDAVDDLVWKGAGDRLSPSICNYVKDRLSIIGTHERNADQIASDGRQDQSPA